MWQTVIVYGIVWLAVGGAVWVLARKLRALRRNEEDGGCGDCPLKEQCRKPEKGRGGKNCENKKPETKKVSG